MNTLASSTWLLRPAADGYPEHDNLWNSGIRAPQLYGHLGGDGSLVDPYDERTWQVDLASPGKNQNLSQLTPPLNLTAVF